MTTITLQGLLATLRQEKTSNREMGDKFERLMMGYFNTDPLYKELFSDLWMWSEWEGRTGQDVGIDLVAQERNTGDYWAIQCKFFEPTHTISKSDIDSFFTASGKDPFVKRMIVSTTDKWGSNAEEALKNQTIPVQRLGIADLENSLIDWSKFSFQHLDKMSLKPKKELRPHQQEAIEKVAEGFKTADRGKLIMACGTGKTFTALKTVERLAPTNGTVLFLVPSLSLLSQTLTEWVAETKTPFHAFAVCSDTHVGKRTKAKTDNEDMSIHDLCYPATTNADNLIRQYKRVLAYKPQLTIVFSTYQSIEAVANAQKAGLPEFDLIICDEAHRTTGATLAGDDESHFVRVHDQAFLKGKKRLYMTATPKLFKDDVKAKAQENDAVLCSMDDENLYGEEFYRLGFGEAVERGLLADYKVLILAVDESYINSTVQALITDENNELNLEDAVKITGCWNGLAKRNILTTEGFEIDKNPMRRAVAFSSSIKSSKLLTAFFAQIVNEHIKRTVVEENPLRCELDHVDGKMNSHQRNQKLSWLKEDTSTQGNVCRILSNARCLSEGVDVPSLDAVLFLNPRNSLVDVVQSVGRVMRKSEGKQYGYIILPIGIPAGVKPEEALSDNQKYKVVWDVLQALRAHDDRFNATINKLELNQQKPDNIQVIGIGNRATDDENEEGKTKKQRDDAQKALQLQLSLGQLEEWRNAIYGKIVTKCGERKYWETWAKEVADIAIRHQTRITALVQGAEPQYKEAFEAFLVGLRENLNPSISEADAIEMLCQHLITKPVFDALFEGYAFTEQNPVSIAMQKMLDVLEGQALEKENKQLEKFYASVHKRVAGVDNAQGRQKIILELYDKFFKTAFPKVVEKLGIVYTPVPVVDFIINSANYALQQEFGVGIGSEGVHVLDPFTGTGTFMVRLLQSGLIPKADLPRKYAQELHANELVLLAYYIAAINIEETYHGLMAEDAYTPFEGIVLTDTFQLAEGEGRIEGVFPANSQRAEKQRKNDIRVIIGNPPYSAGQTSENDGNKNQKYPHLDEQIRGSYAKFSTAILKNSLYDSYIRAIRWASDRIKDKGVICFVTNGSFMDGNATDGVRKCLVDEFTSLYVFNLRGNQRTSGETSRQEGGKIFDGGSRATIAITLLIKNPEKAEKGQLFYHDIGDYLDRKTKLQMIEAFKSVETIPWKRLTPNSSHDWINQRDPAFDAFLSLGDKTNKHAITLFDTYSSGVKTNRDAWAYSFSKKQLHYNMDRMITFYNSEVERYRNACNDNNQETLSNIDRFLSNDNSKISWSGELKEDCQKHIAHQFYPNHIRIGLYRPFCKQSYYFDKDLNNRLYQMPKIFPMAELENLLICSSGIGSSKEFSTLITNTIPDYSLVPTSQCFPLYTYEKVEATAQQSLLSSGAFVGYQRKDNITNEMLQTFQQAYADVTITKEAIFYYVYGILHSPEYKTRFEADLKKMLPRLPLTKETADFWAFSNVGKELAYWHLNYETVEPHPSVEEHQSVLQTGDVYDFYRVEKMRFPTGYKIDDCPDTIDYNSRIRLSGIPQEAWGYVVNGKPALGWIMERYAVTVHKESGIKNDPNLWCLEQENPRYIVDLIKRMVRVSVESVRLVGLLPPLNERVEG
ncbi:MAG: DEAD/DEAH box helicase [Vampirovibrio sp.]|nr:DEAD/DEAH box helicase [Vampirovibrio sp.]